MWEGANNKRESSPTMFTWCSMTVGSQEIRVCLGRVHLFRNLQMTYVFFSRWSLSHQVWVCLKLARHGECQEEFYMSCSKTKSSHLTAFLFIRGLPFNKVKMQLWYATPTLPVSSLLKLWYQVTLPITYLTSVFVCMAVLPGKQTSILYFELWVILCLLSQNAFPI